MANKFDLNVYTHTASSGNKQKQESLIVEMSASAL